MCTARRLTLHKVFDRCWPTGHEGYGLFLCHIVLLITCAWTAGFLVGWLSRRTLWVSAALCLLPCGLGWPWAFRLDLLSRLCMLLFLLPAIWGVRQGLRIPRVHLAAATLLAVTVTILMFSAWTNHALWSYNWLLLLPVWLLVATAQHPQLRIHLAA